jgi:hypothetical protein
MSTSALVQKLWNYCNKLSLGPAVGSPRRVRVAELKRDGDELV